MAEEQARYRSTLLGQLIDAFGSRFPVLLGHDQAPNEFDKYPVVVGHLQASSLEPLTPLVAGHADPNVDSPKIARFKKTTPPTTP